MKINSEKFIEFFDKVSKNRYLNAVSKAMMMTIPATMTGALFTLIKNMPFESYQEFITNTGLVNFLQIPITFTSSIISLIVVFFVAYNVAKSFGTEGRVAGITALLAFLILTPLVPIEIDEKVTNFISFDWLGARGMFVGLILGIVIGRIYSFMMIKKLYIRMPESVPTFVEKAFAAIIPFFVIVTLSSLVSWGFTFTSAGSLHQIIYTILQIPLQNIGGSLPGVIVAYIVINLCWWFGLHGKALVFAVVAPIWTSLSIENLAATNAGTVPPHIIDLGFTTIFMEIGGAGCILGLALLFTVLARSERYRTVGKITLIPTFFGINEPITFGTPVVLNPYFLVPTILAPIVTGILGYISIIIGFVPQMTGASLPTGIPSLVNALILAGWQGLVVQIIAIAVTIVIYYPFFRAADNSALSEENENKVEAEEKVAA